ncbi:MAG: hypothetical protein ACLFRG_00485 [Desulfococcaceae bacterium]
MPKRPFVIRVEGPEARESAKEISGILEKEFNHHSTPAPANGEDGGEAFIVALPSSLLATTDLAARASFKERLDRLIHYAHNRRSENPAAKTVINGPGGDSLFLDQTSSEAILKMVPK